MWEVLQEYSKNVKESLNFFFFNVEKSYSPGMKNLELNILEVTARLGKKV